MSKLNNIIKINGTDYNTLKNSGTLTKNGTTYTYSENDLYLIDNGLTADYVLLGNGSGKLLSEIGSCVIEFNPTNVTTSTTISVDTFKQFYNAIINNQHIICVTGNSDFYSVVSAQESGTFSSGSSTFRILSLYFLINGVSRQVLLRGVVDTTGTVTSANVSNVSTASTVSSLAIANRSSDAAPTGLATWQAIYLPYTIVTGTGPYYLTSTGNHEVLYIPSSSGTRTLYLPTGAQEGESFIIRKVYYATSNTLTVQTQASAHSFRLATGTATYTASTGYSMSGTSFGTIRLIFHSNV